LQPIDQLFDALRAQARDAAAVGTDSPTSTTGTTLTSFQKLYFETNATMTFGSLASARTFADATKKVMAIYKALGASDKVAKGPELQKQLIVALGNHHSARNRPR
jgi:hypothetical protein